jgi:SpoVK/Ycf46/Vps4 family AAA+-type ATPase
VPRFFISNMAFMRYTAVIQLRSILMNSTTPITASDQLARELTIATDASIGVIAIRCPETEVYRVVDEIYALAQTQKVDFRMHTSETGWAEYPRIDPDDTRAEAFDPLEPKDTERSTAPIASAFQALDEQKYGDTGFYVMLDLFFSFGEMVAQTCLRKQAQRAVSSANVAHRLFLVVPNSATIPDNLAPIMHVIEYGYPTRDELNQSLDDIITGLEDEDQPSIEDDEREAIISNGQGMTAYAFETAIAVAITEYGVTHSSLQGFGAEDIIASIRNYKTAMLRKTNVLELQPNVPEGDIGGLDLFKGWMHERKLTYTDAAKEAGVTPSRGAVVVGPPGTGKSMVAKAAGSILSLPVIRFDVGRVFGSYVGQSEQAMRNVLTLIDAMSPCVLMLDEIDKGFAGMQGGGAGSDSGTTSRVFGTFLTWMQERDQVSRPVFLIMTANRIQGLPPELLRKGRVDEIWSVNVPNDDERKEIIKIHARKRGQELNKSDLASITRLSENYVGSEIEQLIEGALVLSLAEAEIGITFELVEREKANFKPMYETRAEDFAAMREWADKNARPASTAMRYSSGGTAPKVRRRGNKGRVRTKVQRSEGS